MAIFPRVNVHVQGRLDPKTWNHIDIGGMVRNKYGPALTAHHKHSPPSVGKFAVSIDHDILSANPNLTSWPRAEDDLVRNRAQAMPFETPFETPTFTPINIPEAQHNIAALTETVNARATKKLNKRKSRRNAPPQIMPTAFPCVFQGNTHCADHKFCKERYLTNLAKMKKETRTQLQDAGYLTPMPQAPSDDLFQQNRNDAPGSSLQNALMIDDDSEIEPDETADNISSTRYSKIQLQMQQNHAVDDSMMTRRVSKCIPYSRPSSGQDPRMSFGLLTDNAASPQASINEQPTLELPTLHSPNAEPWQSLVPYHPLRWSFDDDEKLSIEWLDRMQARLEEDPHFLDRRSPQPIAPLIRYLENGRWHMRVSEEYERESREPKEQGRSLKEVVVLSRSMYSTGQDVCIRA